MLHKRARHPHSGVGSLAWFRLEARPFDTEQKKKRTVKRSVGALCVGGVYWFSGLVEVPVLDVLNLEGVECSARGAAFPPRFEH